MSTPRGLFGAEDLVESPDGSVDWLATARRIADRDHDCRAADFDDRFDAAFRRLHADDRAAIRSRWQ